MIALLLLLCTASVRAGDATRLSAELGWGGAYRVGRWTPLFLTISHDRPSSAVIEVTAAHSGPQGVRIVQPVTIGPTPTTFCLFLVAGYDVELINVDVRDGEGGPLLKSRRPFEAIGDDGEPRVLPRATRGKFIGVSGRGGWNGPPQGSGQVELDVGLLSVPRLPDAPVGYDGLDLLILNAPDLNKLSKPQQGAIASWVRAGGRLLLWADESAVPEDAPLLDVLPAAVGPNVLLEIPQQVVRDAGLPDRFTRLRGRSLQPKAGADAVAVFGGPQATGYAARVGLGRVAILPFDASLLLFSDERYAATFWSKVLSSLSFEAPAEDDAPRRYVVADERLNGIMAAVEQIGCIEGAGSFDFGTIAWTLLGLMFIVGPLDWFVLKMLHRQPWTWATTTGWIGLVTVGSLYTGQLLRSGELHLRTVSLVEQVDGRCVVASEIVAIYSPTTRRYELSVPAGWWQPLPGEQWFASRGLREEYDFLQARDGNAPLPLRVPIWSLRLLHGLRWIDDAPLVEAQLRMGDHGQLKGTIRNLAKQRLEVLELRRGKQRAATAMELPPGGSAEVDVRLEDARPEDVGRASGLRRSLRGLARHPGVDDNDVIVQARLREEQSIADVPGHAAREHHVTVLRAVVPVVSTEPP